ncbi:phage portal protein [Kitasatospora atroaurantiaca]|uniref:HK97 family phage portal protein n=1 Tax=Kitasatospora atroaurantiaca TaxID=285545 RepID=A0A561ERY0_9ACTN|nr:phage portal protein [Kitasatospora atroaurantiaca]TWE18372.1 HK97 family phage portal protein [Kitasatospora atroaurantiaca]
MGFWRALFRGSSSGKSESRVWDDATGELFPYPGLVGQSGQRVNASTALQVSAVFGCVRLLSETIATLPVATYSRRGGARREVTSPTWLDYPTAEPGGVGRIDLLSQVVLSLLLEGNAYLAVTWDGPNIVAIEVLDPSKVRVHTVIIDGRRRKIFDCWDVDRDGNEVALGWFTTRDILHIPGMMLPGDFTGVSPIAYARESIGLALAAQTYGARFFANGAMPGAVVEVPGAMSEEGLARAREAWRLANSGVENAHRVALLTEGAKFSKIAMSPDEAQFLQTRQFQVPEIARIFGVPPHLISDATNSTSWGSGLAEQNQAFAMFSLRPWLERIEAGLTRLLYAESANRQLFVKFSLDGIQRGAPAERMNMYSIGLQQGIYSIDEVRGWEDLEPLPDGLGAAHRVPLNLADVAAPDDAPKAIEPPPDQQSPDDQGDENEGEASEDGAPQPDQAG